MCHDPNCAVSGETRPALPTLITAQKMIQILFCRKMAERHQPFRHYYLRGDLAAVIVVTAATVVVAAAAEKDNKDDDPPTAAAKDTIIAIHSYEPPVKVVSAFAHSMLCQRFKMVTKTKYQLMQIRIRVFPTA